MIINYSSFKLMIIFFNLFINSNNNYLYIYYIIKNKKYILFFCFIFYIFYNPANIYIYILLYCLYWFK